MAVGLKSLAFNLPMQVCAAYYKKSRFPLLILTFTDVDSSSILMFYLPDVSDFSLFLKLDSYTEPGLSEVQFQNLFAKCLGCGLYMTRRTVDFHVCGGDGGSSSATGKVLEVIDLTTVEDF